MVVTLLNVEQQPVACEKAAINVIASTICQRMTHNCFLAWQSGRDASVDLFFLSDMNESANWMNKSIKQAIKYSKCAHHKHHTQQPPPPFPKIIGDEKVPFLTKYRKSIPEHKHTKRKSVNTPPPPQKKKEEKEPPKDKKSIKMTLKE